MGTKRIDRTGRTFGCVHILGPDPNDPRGWRYRMICCGEEGVMDSMRVSFLVKHHPEACADCRAKNRKENATARRAAKERAEKLAAEDRAKAGVFIPGADLFRSETVKKIPKQVLYPFLIGPMGRLNDGFCATHAQHRGGSSE